MAREELPPYMSVADDTGENTRMSDRPTKIEKTDARQAKSGLGVRYVLIGGLVLVVVIFVALFFVLRGS